MALGISLITLAGRGTTPITALPVVASLGFGFSIGFFTVVLNMGLIVLQLVILKRNFPKRQFLQIPFAFLFGSFIDFWMHIVPLPEVMTFSWSILFLVLGVIIQAFGIFAQVTANVVILAGEGAVVALTTVIDRKFGLLKTALDATLVLLAVLLSLLIFGQVEGVREGTLISALFVGKTTDIFFAVKKRLVS
ncbi:TPA: hypothetical protein N2F43_003683 [Salmonella enterica]|nr:hypothetical protein [Salmonella enterica]